MKLIDRDMDVIEADEDTVLMDEHSDSSAANTPHTRTRKGPKIFEGHQVAVIHRQCSMSTTSSDFRQRLRQLLVSVDIELSPQLHVVAINVENLNFYAMHLGADAMAFAEKLVQRRIISHFQDDDHLYVQNEPGRMLLFLPSPYSAEDDERIQSLNMSLSKAYGIGSERLYVDVRIGCTSTNIRSALEQYPAEVYSLIDQARFAAEVGTRQHQPVQFFCDQKCDIDEERFFMLQRLKRAIDKDTFRVFYQPQYELKTGRIVGFEALVRWFDRQGDYIPPAMFIPLAEHNGLIIDIERLVLREALTFMEDVPKPAEGSPLNLSVNISVLHFSLPHFVETLTHLLQQFRFQSRQLTLEITETTQIQQQDQLIENLKKVRALGIQVAIDDIGTGHSSLERILDMPCDIIKIDTRFVISMLNDEKARKIVTSLVMLSLGLGKTVVAEGIESREHETLLMDLGCRIGQGYYYSRPLDEQIIMQRFFSDTADIASPY